VRRAAGELDGSSSSAFAEQEAVVSVARDIAQSAMLAGGGPNATTSPLFADADHALLTGQPAKAVTLLTQAAA